MIDYEKILQEKYVKSGNPNWEERYIHSLAVCKMALLLNEKLCLGLDKNKVYLAGILHDYAKFDTYDYYQKIVAKYNLSSDLLNADKKLFHAFFGPYIIYEELGISDKEILSAIRYHTTGIDNMTTLEELIFLSDYVEENRIGEEFAQVREIAFTNIKKAVASELSNLVSHLKNINKEIYIDTLKAYDFYKKYLEK